MSKRYDVDLSDTFLCEPDEKLLHVPQESSDTFDTFSDVKSVSLLRNQLVAEQQKDSTLAPLFDTVAASGQVECLSMGYFVLDGLLMHK